ncbi:MAG: response regulator [Spirochaetaceae bacterium]|nr:response regulator [Spirochaetaceae bacterium]
MPKGTVLVVEDEAMIGLEVSLVLRNSGYSVPQVVMSSDDVIKNVMQEKPDLILCDIRIGGILDGVEAIQRIRLINSEIPVVYMTAYGDRTTCRRAMKTNPVAILDKPVLHEVLVNTIDKALVGSVQT